MSFLTKPIITSLLDLDLYKLTVHQIIFNRFANVEGEYEFTCRNKDKVDLLGLVPQEQLEAQIKMLGDLKLSEDEYEWLAGRGYFQETYLQYLANFRLMPERQITVVRDEANRTYRIRANGPLAAIILYETLILSITNEIFEYNYTLADTPQGEVVGEEVWFEGARRLTRKALTLLEYNQECEGRGIPVPKIIEFGTRRRYSKEWQKEVLHRFKLMVPDNIVGTSNVALAKEFNIKEIGTFGHEFVMAMQGIYPVQHSQRQAFKIWLSEYRGLWGTALTDTLGDEKFFKDFTFELAKGFDGVRQDSGDPAKFGERIIKMYEGYGIDPRTKKLVFSDGLDIDKVIELHRQFVGRIQVIFGVGTNLTNDLGNPVLHIVMKLTKCNGQDVCKLSANPAKASCKNPLYLDYVRMAIEQY